MIPFLTIVGVYVCLMLLRRFWPRKRVRNVSRLVKDDDDADASAAASICDGIIKSAHNESLDPGRRPYFPGYQPPTYYPYYPRIDDPPPHQPEYPGYYDPQD